VLSTNFGGEPIALLPERAAFLPAQGLLLVADAHIGKAQAYRRLGQPVPETTTAAALARLDAALARCGAAHLVFLGDLLHAAAGRSAVVMQAFAAWRARHPQLAITLLEGNHDRRAGALPADWGVALRRGPWALAGGSRITLDHEPEASAGRAVLAGHVHPAAVLSGRAHQRLRLPCFHLGPHLGVLPAFGEFTGMHVLPRGPEDRVFVVAEDQVLALPPRP
jgi:DNA ligase-associated metallophosphoesterase